MELGASEAHGHELSFSPSGYSRGAWTNVCVRPATSLSSSRVPSHWRAPGSSEWHGDSRARTPVIQKGGGLPLAKAQMLGQEQEIGH